MEGYRKHIKGVLNTINLDKIEKEIINNNFDLICKIYRLADMENFNRRVI